jgi:hypothetical protein
MTVKTNARHLVCVSTTGQVAHPAYPGLPAEPYRLTADGKPFLWPTFGGIVYNVSVGDPAFGWAGDCVHPSVSIANANPDRNRGLNIFACVGNRARVTSGLAKGSEGVVTGKSGRFSEQVIVHFPREIRRKIAIGDQILVRSEGVGLSFPDHPDVSAKSISADLFDLLPKQENDGILRIGVAATVPAHLVGAGAGLTSEGGSLHMQSTDRGEVARRGLDMLRLGDVVAIEDTDSRYNHGYLRGAMSIGIVGQTDGPRAGYGPGMTVVLTAPAGQLAAFEDEGTNIADLLGIEA